MSSYLKCKEAVKTIFLTFCQKYSIIIHYNHFYSFHGIVVEIMQAFRLALVEAKLLYIFFIYTLIF